MSRTIRFIALAALVLSACSDPSVTPKAPDSTAVEGTIGGTLLRLQGSWQSMDDPGVVVEFSGTQFAEHYAGEASLRGTASVVDDCSDGTPSADGRYFLVASDGDQPYCYAIVELTETELAYSMVGGRGNTLRFVRVDNLAATYEGAAAPPRAADQVRKAS